MYAPAGPAGHGNITSGNGIGGVLLYRVLNSTQGLRLNPRRLRAECRLLLRHAMRHVPAKGLRVTCRTTAGSSRVRSLRAVSDQPYDSRACHCHLALNARACQAYQLPAPHTTRPNSSVTIWTHQVVQPRLAQVWHRIRPDGHKCEAVGGRIWSLALGGAVRTAYGLRLKLTNENPHQKLVSPAELTELSSKARHESVLTHEFEL